MATTLQKPTARPRPRRIWVADPLPSLDPLPGLCGVCGQEAVAVDPYGLGWCTAHAPLELLCP
jgi:hypothetical protein